MFSTNIALVIFLLAGSCCKAQVVSQNFTFPQAGAQLDVGSQVILRWHNASSLFQTVTITLWDASPDGIFEDLTDLDFIQNVGSVQWTVVDSVGPHRFGIGNGPPGALANTSESDIFTIRRPISAITASTSFTTSRSSGTATPAQSTQTFSITQANSIDLASMTFTSVPSISGTPSFAPGSASEGSRIAQSGGRATGFVLAITMLLLLLGMI